MEYARTISGAVDVLLLIPDRYQPSAEGMDTTGVPVEWLPWPRQREILPSISFMRRLAARVREWQPDVVHILMNGHVWTTALLGLFRPIPVITTVHDVSLHLGDTSARRVPNLFFDRGVRQSDAIIVHGSTLREEAMAKWSLHPERCFVLPHIPLWRYREIAAAEGFHRKSDSAFRILFFGRICEYKGLRYLLSAIEKIERGSKAVKLVIAGAGELSSVRDILSRVSAVEVHNEFVSSREAARLFAEADVLALPYVEASQSGVLMIAMTFGLPVVATDVGEIGETVSRTGMGLLVPPRDSLRLAEALDRVREDVELRHSLAANALTALGTSYSKETLASGARLIYEEVRELARSPYQRRGVSFGVSARSKG
jgi:glycosyltransferase involved in cell wall biosynthesis